MSKRRLLELKSELEKREKDDTKSRHGTEVKNMKIFICY